MIRITISLKELKILQELCKEQGQGDLYKKLHVEEEKAYKSKTVKKTKATKKATKTRQDAAKKKIENSINMMRLMNDKITVYSVAKDAGVSYNTASKYKEYILKNSNS
ncbi:MAG: hypothetical protein MJK08_00290 [Campylobacterales bacterium]|nr:hypothetical protein [Campylobacterales bacterium]NQY52159.1 hypothetical protein [Campylobacteraceae bacterium]